MRPVKSSFFSSRFKKWLTRWRDPETGQFVHAERVRVTVGLNGLVKHHVYRNFTESKICWKDEAEDVKSELRNRLIKQGEKFLGYPQEEWWGENIYYGEEVIPVENEPI